MNKRQYKKRYIYWMYDMETWAFYKIGYHHIMDVKPKSPKEQRLFNREWVTNEGGKGRKGKKKTPFTTKSGWTRFK